MVYPLKHGPFKDDVWKMMMFHCHLLPKCNSSRERTATTDYINIPCSSNIRQHQHPGVLEDDQITFPHEKKTLVPSGSLVNRQQTSSECSSTYRGMFINLNLRWLLLTIPIHTQPLRIAFSVASSSFPADSLWGLWVFPRSAARASPACVLCLDPLGGPDIWLVYYSRDSQKKQSCKLQ